MKTSNALTLLVVAVACYIDLNCCYHYHKYFTTEVKTIIFNSVTPIVLKNTSSFLQIQKLINILFCTLFLYLAVFCLSSAVGHIIILIMPISISRVPVPGVKISLFTLFSPTSVSTFTFTFQLWSRNDKKKQSKGSNLQTV